MTTYETIKKQLLEGIKACGTLGLCYPNSGIRSKCRATAKKLRSIVEDVEAQIMTEENKHGN